jgi:hypothetical protein
VLDSFAHRVDFLPHVIGVRSWMSDSFGRGLSSR